MNDGPSHRELADAAVDRLLDRTLGRFADRPTLTVEEAAELLGVGRSTAYDAARSGDLPVVQLGRRRLVPTLGLAAWLLAAGDGETPALNGGPRSLVPRDRHERSPTD